jgi:hypothetical protein
MEIIKFALHKNIDRGKEEKAVISHCILNRLPYMYFSKIEDVPHDYIPVGNLKWVEKFLHPNIVIPDYYPEFLKDYLFRKVWRTDKWPVNEKVFIKPADFHKRFTGFCTTGGYRKKKKGPYWCSEIVHFINEWRYYVADGKILTGEWYDGDEVNTPDAPDLGIKIPERFCGAIDFGVTNQGKLALVESQPPYACGWYGKNDKLYVEWLVKGWDYLRKYHENL